MTSRSDAIVTPSSSRSLGELPLAAPACIFFLSVSKGKVNASVMTDAMPPARACQTVSLTRPSRLGQLPREVVARGKPNDHPGR